MTDVWSVELAGDQVVDMVATRDTLVTTRWTVTMCGIVPSRWVRRVACGWVLPARPPDRPVRIDLVRGGTRGLLSARTVAAYGFMSVQTFFGSVLPGPPQFGLFSSACAGTSTTSVP